MANNNYTINDIESLSFRDGVRLRVGMYLGSADMQGVYNAIQEIISNSIDEYYMGYGKKITINLEGNKVTIADHGRGIPFGIKEDGSNVLVDIFSKPHTGGKFNDKIYSGVGGLNGIGAKATCLTSLTFTVVSCRGGEAAAATWYKGNLDSYRTFDTKCSDGTTITFEPDAEVYNVEPIKIDFEELCERCKNLSFLTKGLTFELVCGDDKRTYCASNGLTDLLAEYVNKPIHKTPIYLEGKEGDVTYEIALQWTKGKERSFTFTNGLYQSDGGTSITGLKTAITLFMKKKFKGEFDGDMARTGLVYAVSCKVPQPSFSNQTKTKINNPELRGICQKATGAALSTFEVTNAAEMQSIVDFLASEKKAEQAAENARKKVLEATKNIEQNQKRKVFASDKLKDAEYLGPDSILLCVEGNSAASSIAVARDVKRYGILALRGKVINCLANKDEDIFDNEEIKLLLSAMNIIPGKYDSKKLRYGKIGICTDSDSDGYHIGLLIMAALHYLAPEFIEEGRLCWLRSPLYIVKNGTKETYYYTDEEMASRKSTGGVVQRNKGLGSLSADQAHASMFTPEFQRLDILHPDACSTDLLERLMGDKPAERKEYIFNNVDFSTIKE